MVIGAVLSLGLAVLVGGTGLRTLRRGPGTDVTGQIQRLIAPTQIAAAVMLAAGGIVALAAPAGIGLVGLIVGALGAIGTIGAGSWQGARYAARQQASAGGCGSDAGCAGCSQLCDSTGAPADPGD